MASHICPSPRLIRLIDHLHRLGPRSVGAALLELADPASIERCLERFAKLSPEIIEAMGGRDFPDLPLVVVPEAAKDECAWGHFKAACITAREVPSALNEKKARVALAAFALVYREDDGGVAA